MVLDSNGKQLIVNLAPRNSRRVNLLYFRVPENVSLAVRNVQDTWYADRDIVPLGVEITGYICT
jgi:hypothetical protein